jgi:hypothetical protein
VTARHYIENKHRSVLGLGHLLSGGRTVIPMSEEKNLLRRKAPNEFFCFFLQTFVGSA